MSDALEADEILPKKQDNPIANLLDDGLYDDDDYDEDDEDLIERVKAKAAARQFSDTVSSPAQPRGLGDVFQTSAFEVTEEEIAERSRTSANVDFNDPTWDELTAQLAEVSCAFFAQEILTGPVERPYNGRFLIGEHHEEWDYLVQNFDRICCLAPRDHGKTFFFDFAYPIWRAVHRPNGSGFIFSATKEQAVRILADIKEEIEGNPKLQYLVPRKKENWSNTHIKLNNGHHIYARGFGTKVRGAHPDWIVVDDGLNDETAYSELVRNKQIDYFYTAITNMIVPGGQIIVVGTPFHQADLYADLKKNSEYEYREYKALNEDTETCLWPERYPYERLLKRKEEIGNVRFTREFQCSPISDDMSLFPGYLFHGEPTEQMAAQLGAPLEYWQTIGIEQVFMGVDFAMSSNVSADYTCIFVIGTDRFQNRWVMDIVRAKGMAYKSQLSLINRIGKKYDAGLIYLEANQMQRIFGDELIRTTDLPIKQFVTGVQKNSLDKGVPSLRVLLENKKFRIPRGDKKSVETTDIWIDEMRNFTWHEGKLQGVGTHDDTVMACWICDQAVRQGAFSYDFGDGDMSGESLDDVIRDMTEDPNEESDGANGASGNLVDDEATRGLMPSFLKPGWF